MQQAARARKTSEGNVVEMPSVSFNTYEAVKDLQDAGVDEQAGAAMVRFVGEVVEPLATKADLAAVEERIRQDMAAGFAAAEERRVAGEERLMARMEAGFALAEERRKADMAAMEERRKADMAQSRTENKGTLVALMFWMAVVSGGAVGLLKWLLG